MIGTTTTTTTATRRTAFEAADRRVGVSMERFEPIENCSSPPAPPFFGRPHMKTLARLEPHAMLRARRAEDASRTFFATHRSAQSDKPRGDTPMSPPCNSQGPTRMRAGTTMMLGRRNTSLVCGLLVTLVLATHAPAVRAEQ